MGTALKKIIPLIVLLSLLGGIFGYPTSAHAQSFDDIQFKDCGGLFDPFMCALGWVLLLVGDAIKWFAGILLNLGADMLKYMLTIDQSILTAEGSIVRSGFEISLNTANLFFILVVILIAFMTIFRIEQYSIKKLLPRLIVAVVLINFSLLFAGAILDFARVLGSSWVDQINPEAIGKALQPQSSFVGKLDADNTGEFLEGLMIILISIAYITVFTFLAAIVIITTAIMILVRYIWLVFLLVLMPFAWLLWVTPFYSEYGKKWWDKFIQWALFLPVVAFFLSLAFKVNANIPKVNVNASTSNELTLIKDFLQVAVNMIVTLGIMIGGLIAAQKFSITGAKAGRDFAGALGRGVTGYKSKPGQEKTFGEKMGARVRGGLARVPLLRNALRVTAGGRKTIEEMEARREVKRAEGPKIQVVDEGAGIMKRAAQKTVQYGQKGKKWIGDNILQAKSGADIVKGVNAGTIKQSEVQRLAGSKLRSDAALTAGGAAAVVAGTAIAGPVGAGIALGGAFLVGKLLKAQRARAIYALAEMSGGKFDPIMVPGDIGYNKKERTRVRNATARLAAKKEIISKADKARKQNQIIDHIRHAAHELEESEGGGHGHEKDGHKEEGIAPRMGGEGNPGDGGDHGGGGHGH